jgi:hypothetical protein
MFIKKTYPTFLFHLLAKQFVALINKIAAAKSLFQQIQPELKCFAELSD